MKKFWDDEKIIKYMEKATGVLNGYITRDDDNMPLTYQTNNINEPVFALLFEEDNNDMDYIQL